MIALCQRRWHFATVRKPGGFVQNWGEACQVGRRRPRQKLPGGCRVGRGARSEEKARASLGQFWGRALAMALRPPRLAHSFGQNLLIGELARRVEKNTILSAKAREGSRRTPLCPRRAIKGREEHLSIREGSRRVAKNTPLSTKGRLEHHSIREARGSRRTPLCPRRAIKGREEHHSIREGTRRVTRRVAKAKGREEHRFVRGGRGGTQITPFFDARSHAESQGEGRIQRHPQGEPLRWDGPVEGKVNGTLSVVSEVGD